MGKLLDKLDNFLAGKVIGKAARTGITFGTIATLPGLMIGYSAKHGMEKELDAIGASLGQAIIEDMSMSRFDQTMAIGTWRHAPGIGRKLPPVVTNRGGYDTGLYGPDR